MSDSSRMATRNFASLSRDLARGRYAFLFLSLLLLGVLYPVLRLGLWGTVVWTVAFWLVLLGSVHAVHGHGAICKAARGLGVIALASGVVGLLCYNAHDRLHGWLYAVLAGLNLVFLVFISVVLLADVLAGLRVDKDRILGAACVYVLIGLTFAHALLVVHSLSTEPVIQPVANAPSAHAPSVLADYLYFSFVTLSTLGYGDFAPQGLTARLLASAEAIGGQLYLTVLIARLIGLHISQSREAMHVSETQRG